MINEEFIIQRRNFCIRNLVRDFLLSFKAFKELKNKYKTSGIESSDFDLLVGGVEKRGLLKKIKDLCPLIWDVNVDKDIDNNDVANPFYFTTIVNLLYYEIGKMRELCKFIEYNDILLKKFTSSDKCKKEKIFSNCHKFVDIAFLELKEGFKKVEKFFKEAIGQLKCLIVREKSNSLLIRFILIEGKNLVEELLLDREGTLDELLLNLFPEGIDQAYCFAAEDYFEGSWFDKAKEAYLYALNINPECEQARDGLRLLDKRLNELAHIQEREKERFLIR